MKNKIILSVIVIILLLIVSVVLFQYSKYIRYKSCYGEGAETIIEDLCRYYYVNYWDCPNNIESVLLIVPGFSHIGLTERAKNVIKCLEEHSDEIRIHKDENDKTAQVFIQRSPQLNNNNNNGGYSKIEYLSFWSYLFNVRKNILLTTFSFEDIHICKFARRDYLSFRDGSHNYSEQLESFVVNELYDGIIHKIGLMDWPERRNANILFKVWYDDADNKWQSELLCNYNEIEISAIDKIEIIFINELVEKNAVNYMDSLIMPVLIR